MLFISTVVADWCTCQLLHAVAHKELHMTLLESDIIDILEDLAKFTVLNFFNFEFECLRFELIEVKVERVMSYSNLKSRSESSKLDKKS